jgi:hypothetical protein
MEEVLYNFLGNILYFTNATFRRRAQARWNEFGLQIMIADIGLWVTCFALVCAILVIGSLYLLNIPV